MRWPWTKAEPAPEPEPTKAGFEDAPGGGDAANYGDTGRKVHLVPASNSLGQIIDYYNGTGDGGLLSLYSFSGAGAVFQYSALARCVEFVAATVAGLISDPDSLIVLRKDGKESTSRTAKAAMRLLTETPNGEDSAHEFLEDLVADYCTSGNMLCAVIRSASFPVSMVRMNPWTSSAQDTMGGIVYDLHDSEAGWGQAPPRRLPARDVVHGRWPRLRATGAGSYGQRRRFALPPVQVLRPALGIGVAGDRHVAEWFTTGGTGSQAAIIYKDSLENETQRTEFDQYLSTKHSRTPLVLFDDPSVVSLNQRAQSSETGMLREFQVREVCRFFGIPPAVLGELGGLRGIDIGAMTKAAWVFGIRHHVTRVLSALSFRLLPAGERLEVDRLGFILEDPSTLASVITATREGPNGTGDVTRGETRRWLSLPREPRNGETLPDRAMMDQPPEAPAPPALPPGMENGNESDGSTEGVSGQDRLPRECIGGA